MKPMLASDYKESKVKFPVIAQPKIDGVRGLNMLGPLTGRSLKTHANRYTTELYSHSCLLGFDGELAAQSETHPDLCRITSSALSTIEGQPYTVWWLFDYVVEETKDLPYSARYDMLKLRVTQLCGDMRLRNITSRLRIVPSVLCNTLEELLELDAAWLDMGFEGTILRDPDGLHKQGRSTVTEGGLLRIKRFIQEEAEVLDFLEGETNNNEAQINELGQTFRSTHKENMTPNGQVGKMLCRNTKDGKPVTVSPGRMTVEDRVKYFDNPSLLIGKIIKYQHFPKGVKDKPRFPTFQTIKAPSDIGEEL